MSIFQKRLATPANITIKPYRMDFKFGAEIPKYWCDNDPCLTHFIGALSTFFPDGERFFVDAVRHFRHVVQHDKNRQQEISGFIKIAVKPRAFRPRMLRGGDTTIHTTLATWNKSAS